MPYPLFNLGLRAAARQRLQRLEDAGISANRVSDDDLMELFWSFKEAAGG